METHLLKDIAARDGIEDSGKYAAEQGFDHTALVSIIKSLSSADMVTVEVGALALLRSHGQTWVTGDHHQWLTTSVYDARRTLIISSLS